MEFFYDIFSTKSLTRDINSCNIIGVEVLVVYEILDYYTLSNSASTDHLVLVVYEILDYYTSCWLCCCVFNIVLVVYEILDHYSYPTIIGVMMLISGLTSDHYYFLKIILIKLLTSNINYCNIIIKIDFQNWLSQFII